MFTRHKHCIRSRAIANDTILNLPAGADTTIPPSDTVPDSGLDHDDFVRGTGDHHLVIVVDIVVVVRAALAEQLE